MRPISFCDNIYHQIEEELTRHSGTMALEEFLEVAGRIDVDALPSTMTERREEIARLEARRSELDAAVALETNQIQQMDGSAGAAELAEKAQETLAELRDKAEVFARLRLASFLLQQQLERYREANQGPILQRAGEIFRCLTSESFSGVAPEYDERDTPVLVGVRPSGEKVRLEGMSDGTCDQLYLALRLASIEQRLSAAEPMPMVLDDILVNFDDRRATAALRVLAELSHKTQVIFFTHHRHLAEIAQESLDASVLFSHTL